MRALRIGQRPPASLPAPSQGQVARHCSRLQAPAGLSKQRAKVAPVHSSEYKLAAGSTSHVHGQLRSGRKMSSTTVQAGPSSSRSATSDSAIAERQNGSPGSFTSWEYLVGLCAVSVVICYADRSNLSTAVLPMAQEFGWDKAFQGVVLSSFFGGYALTQMLGGQLADKYGGKLVLAAGVALWSFFTYTTPEGAGMGAGTLLTFRVLLGVGEGVAFPAIHSLIARNVPYEKQSTAVGIVTAASYVGVALAFGLSPLIIDEFGWRYVFYLFAALALLWLPFWLPIKTAPPQHSSQSDEESDPLLASTEVDTESGSFSRKPKSSPSPFELNGLKGLLKRKEVWAICVAQYTGSWGLYGLLSWLPTFFADYYGVPISDLGGYTFLPYIVQGGTGMLAGVVADSFIQSGWSVRKVRILLQTLGMLGPAACLLLAVSPAVGASAPMASNLITVGLGFSALTLGGVSVSHLDIAPRHAGVIFGAGNTAATLAGLISVPVTGYVLDATNSWPLVFSITAGHYILGTVMWALWVGDKQLPEDLLDSEADVDLSIAK